MKWIPIIFLCFSALATDTVNITNVPVASSIPTGSYALGTTGQVTRLLPISQMSVLSATTAGTSTNVVGMANVISYGAVGNGIADDTDAITNAIYAIKMAGGGMVYFPVGTYLIRRTIWLPTNLELRGDGKGTILTKPTSVSSLLTTNVNAGNSYFTVADATGFTVGSGIYAADTANFEWSSLRAVITNVIGNTIYFNSNCPASYQTTRAGTARTSFSLLRNEVNASNIVVRGIVLNQNKSAADINQDFTTSAIEWENAWYCLVDKCSILNSPADSYSDQGNGVTNSPAKSYNMIRDSHISAAGRHTVHLGTCLDGAKVINNTMEDYGTTSNGFAVFYCAFATRTLVEGNTVRNGYGGFCDIDDRDYGNIIANNTIKDMSAYGIQGIGQGYNMASSGYTVVSGNQLFNATIRLSLPNSTIVGNTIELSGQAKTGIYIESAYGSNSTVVANSIFGNQTGASQGIYIAFAYDVKLIGNTITAMARGITLDHANRTSCYGNSMVSPTDKAWWIATSTNITIAGDWTTFSTVITEIAPNNRILYNGIGDNGTNNPNFAGEWNAASGRMFDGALVHWNNGYGDVYSMFKNGNGWATLNSNPVFPQFPWIPTNKIPPSVSGITNYVLCNLSNTVAGTVGGQYYVATNFSAAGSFIILKPTMTQTTWP